MTSSNKIKLALKDSNKIVTIIWRFLPHYRYDFFNRLKDALADFGIELRFIYGKNFSVPVKGEVDIAWELRCRRELGELADGKYTGSLHLLRFFPRI